MTETTAGILTVAGEYDQLQEKMRECQEHCANISHLMHAEYSDKRKAEMWLHTSELFKQLQEKFRLLYTGKTQ